MDTTNTNEQTTVKYNSYKGVLDKPLSKTKRKIAVSLLDGKSVTEAAKEAGTTVGYINKEGVSEEVVVPTAAKLMKKAEILDRLLNEVDAIIETAVEGPLRYADKLKAISLRAELSGLAEKKGNTFNTNVFNLREATSEELAEELDRIEKQKRSKLDMNAIDAEIVE